MNKNQNDFAKVAQDLVSRTIADQVRAAQRYYDLTLRYGRGELSPQTLYDETLRFASQETGRYISDVTLLGLNYYREWFALNQSYSSRFLEVLGSKPVTQAQTVITENPNRPTPVKRVAMELNAPSGQEAVRSFVLENKRGGVADISFDISEFNGPAGTAPFSAPLQIDPPNFTLEAGQERTVTLRLRMEPELFMPGTRYDATVVVHGYGGLELGVTVWADPLPSSLTISTPPSAKSSSSQPAKNSRRKST